MYIEYMYIGKTKKKGFIANIKYHHQHHNLVVLVESSEDKEKRKDLRMIKVSDLLKVHSKVKTHWNRETNETTVYVYAYNERRKAFGFKHYLPKVEEDVQPSTQSRLDELVIKVYKK